MARKQMSEAKREQYREEGEQRKTELLGKLSEGIAKLTSSEEWQRYLDVQSRFHHYSFRNTMLILSQMPYASRVASFKKWQELGRHVVKGSQSIRVFAPVTRKVTPEDDAKASDGSMAAKAQGTPSGDEAKPAREVLAGFRLVPVFDISQTEGDELPSPVKLLTGEDTQGAFGKLVQVAESIGFKVQSTPEVDGYPGANGLCEYGPRLITVASDRSGIQQVKTLAHEIGHAKLHDPGNGLPENMSRGQCELEAESVAYVTCANLGIETDDYSFGYVAGWACDDAEKAEKLIKASGARIQGAAHSILGEMEKQAKVSPESEAAGEPAEMEAEAA